MGARQKLNQSYVNGSLLLAILAGWFTDSGIVFLVTFAILIGLNLYRRQIRLRRRQREPPTTTHANSHRGDEPQ